MPTAHVLQHVAIEGPGRIAPALTACGLTLRIHHLYAGAPVPSTIAADDLLLVMGGPMGVADLGDGRFPFLANEVALLRQCLSRERPVIGVCLGSQLLAHAAGAVVATNDRPGPDGRPEPAREVGWAPVQFHDVATRPELSGLHHWEWMLHWHGDTWQLPRGAELLASTPICPSQAFRLGRAIGWQFHPEVDPSDLEAWLAADGDYACAAAGPDARERIRADTARLFPAWRAIGDRLIANALAVLLGKR